MNTSAASTAAPVVESRRAPGILGVARRALKVRRTQVGLGLTGVVLLIALFGPMVAPHSPSDIVGAPYQGPMAGAVLGTDYLGEDVFSRVLWGGRSVVWMAVAATTIGMVGGVSLGLAAGYGRRAVDEATMRSLDVLLVFPQIILVLLFVSLLGSHLWLIVVIVGLGWVPGVARVTRGLTLSIVRQEYVQSCQAIGLPSRQILLGEVLPNISIPLLVEFGLRLTWSIGVIAAVSFLGFGIQPPNADWGLMINENRNGLVVQSWGLVAPVLCIAIFTIGTNLCAEGLATTISGRDRHGSAA
jgi:peptide/nickel transport system permease protein